MTRQRAYIVAATPRSGSSLLCDGLLATGIAGRPEEVFAPDFRSMWEQELGLEPGTRFGDYLQTALAYGWTVNDVYGVKIHWMHVATLAAELSVVGEGEWVLDALFPDAAYVHIVRRDRRAQALSYFRALATNEWSRFENAENNGLDSLEPELDAREVERLELELAEQQQGWQQYFQRRAIDPLIIEYEALDADYRGEVARVLQYLGLDTAAARSIPGPRLVRQADELTARWREAMDNLAGAAVASR